MPRIGSVYVGLNVDIGQMSRFRQAAGMVDRDSRRMRTALGSTSRSVGHLRGQMNSMYRARLFGESLRTITRTNDEVQRLRASFVALSAVTGTGLTGALGASYLLQTADRARLLSNQLRTVTEDTADLANIQERLYQVSQRTRSSYDATTKIYARTARATEFLGISQQNLLRITETVQKAFAVGGATQAEATGAAIQLSQGIASDRFSGEEFRSVAENAPVLLQGMAKTLGVTIGRLREMAHAGELTAATVTKAILEASDEIDESFNETIATVGQSLTRLDNAFLRYIGNVDESYGLTESLAQAVSNLAENFDEVANFAGNALLLGAAGLAGRGLSTFAGRRVGGFQEEMQTRRQALDIARMETEEIRSQVTANQRKMASMQAAYTAQVNAQHAAARTAKEQHQFNLANQKQLTKINRLRKEGHALQQSLVASTQRLTVATRQATITATALNAVRRVGGSVLSFFGGPVGIGLTAAIAGMGLYYRQAAKAAEQTENIVQKLQDMGYLTADAADEMERFQNSVAEGKFSQLQVELMEFQTELDKTIDRMRKLDLNPDPLAGMQAPGPGRDSPAIKQLREMRAEIIDNQEMSDELRTKLEDIALANPELASIIMTLVALGERMNALAEATADWTKELQDARDAAFSLDGAMDMGLELRRQQRAQAEKDQFFYERNRPLGQDEITKAIEERADKILKAAEDLDAAVTRAEAMAQARVEIMAETAKKGLRDLIGFAEGTDKGRGYNETLDYGRWTGGDRNLVAMTLNEILQLQKQMLANPENRRLYGNGRGSSALGRYQITSATLRDMMAELDLSGNERFDPAMQDRLANQLIRRRGRSVTGLRNEWQGLRKVDPNLIMQAFDEESLSMDAVDESITANIEKRNKQKKAVDDLIFSLQDEIAQQDLEAAMLGKTDLERVKALKTLELEQQYMKAGVAITADVRKEIELLANAYAMSTVAAEKQSESFDQFMERYEERIATQRDLVGGFLQDINSGLRQGKSLWESMGDAALNVLAKISDRLIDGVLDSLFQVNEQAARIDFGRGKGGGGGILGAIFGGIGKLFGFDDGGFTGKMDKRKIAGFVHGREFVVNAEATEKWRPLLEAINSGAGYMKGGYVGQDAPMPKVSEDAMQRGGELTVKGQFEVKNGNLIPLMTDVSGVVAGRAVQGAGKQMPQKIDSIQKRRTS